MSDHTTTVESKPAEAGAAHAHEEHHGSVYAHAKPYLFVGYTLFALTALTVGLSYVKFEHSRILSWAFGLIGVHGFAINIVIGLCVAAFKVGLVGAWFMHLKNEGGQIWRPLAFTFFFVTGLFMLFILAYHDPIPTSVHWHH